MTLLIQDIPYHRPLLQNSHWKKNALHCHMIQSFFHCFRLVDLGYLHHLYFGCLIRLSGVVFAAVAAAIVVVYAMRYTIVTKIINENTGLLHIEFIALVVKEC